MQIYKRRRTDKKLGKVVEGRYYYADFVVNGVRYFLPTKQHRKQAAEAVAWKMREEIINGTFKIKKRERPLFGNFVARRVMPIVEQANAQKPRTVEFYRTSFAKILAEGDGMMAKLRVDEIDEKVLMTYRLSLGELMPATIDRRLSCIRKALNIARREKLIAEVPDFKGLMLKNERRREFVFSDELRELFIEGGSRTSAEGVPEIVPPVDEPYRSVFRFLSETGLRISECCGLLLSDVYHTTQGSYLHVRRQLAKSKKERYVPLIGQAREIVLAQERLSKSEYLFVRLSCRPTAKKAKEPQQPLVSPICRHLVSQAFAARAKMLGLPWDAVLHSLRHTALTNLGRAGATAFQIMRASGHSSLDQVQRYVHPVPAEIMQAFARMDAMTKGAGMVEVADTALLEGAAERRGGSNPPPRTKTRVNLPIHKEIQNSVLCNQQVTRELPDLGLRKAEVSDTQVDVTDTLVTPLAKVRKAGA